MTNQDDAVVTLVFTVDIPWSQFLEETTNEHYVKMSIDTALDYPEQLKFVQGTMKGGGRDGTYTAEEIEYDLNWRKA